MKRVLARPIGFAKLHQLLVGAVMYAEKVNWGNFNHHLFSGENRPNVSKVLKIRRNGSAQPFVARYILDKPRSVVPVAPVMDLFVPMVQMAARAPYDAFDEGKHVLRPSTQLGALSIRDRRVETYSINVPINNVSFYIPVSEISALTDRLRAPRIDALPTLQKQEHHDPVMFHVAKLMMHALDRPSEVSALFLDHMFDAVCIHIVKTYGGLENRETQHRGALTPRQERRIKSFLLDDLQGDARLEDLAASCGMSRGHFIRSFKQSTGMPPHRWLVAQRVDRARAFLQSTTKPISEIALDCGFADQCHLTRAFSKAVGATPAAWRRDRRD